jgi:hypothetical protein
VAERVLRVSWPVLPIGLVLSTAVCAFVLWRSASQGGDLQYQQAVVAHGMWLGLGQNTFEHDLMLQQGGGAYNQASSSSGGSSSK